MMLQNYDPNDPDGACRRCTPRCRSCYPGSTSLDIHNDLMLDGTADGYVGRRPLDRSEDWTNPPSGWVWQWMAYNDDASRTRRTDSLDTRPGQESTRTTGPGGC